MDKEILYELLTIMEKHQLEELEWENTSGKVKLKKKTPNKMRCNSMDNLKIWREDDETQKDKEFNYQSEYENKVEDKKREVLRESNLFPICAETIGTIYLASSPEAEPYVKQGDVIDKGTVIGILEAMKMMNEIEAPKKLKIESIEVKNETVVEYGQVLFMASEVE